MKNGKKLIRNKTYLAGILLLAVLACFHFLDTCSGAAESGDAWLVGRFCALAAAALAAAVVLGALLYRGRARLETVYAAAALVFGAMFLYVLPPLSAPDEISHYISAYQMSNRLMGKQVTGEDGKVVIREEDWFAEDSRRDFAPYVTGDGMLATDEEGADGAVVLGQTLTEETYRLIHEKGVWGYQDPVKVPGAPYSRDTESFPALSNHLPVATTPAAYFVPALGITAARFFNLNNLWLLYLGRLFNMLFLIAMIYLAMRRLPFGKEILFGTALLPMTVHLSASYSYDVLLIGGIAWFTAVCLDLAYRAGRVRFADVVLLAAIMAAAGPCKIVYAVFMGLCLLIPVRRFGGWGKWLLSAVCVLGSWAVVMILVNGQTVASYAAESENYIGWAGEAGYSMGMLIHRPVNTLQLIYHTIAWQAEHFHLSMIGAWLGNLDTVLDTPYVVVVLLTGGLLCLAFRKPGEQLIITGPRRIWILFLCLACAGGLAASMLLAWTPVSSKVICGVQGRYFLPFLPVLLMACKNDTIVLTKNPDRSILYLMCCADGYVAMRIFSTVAMRL